MEKVLEKIYDVQVDSHIVAGYPMIRRVVDAFGGVEITLTEKEADYLNRTNFISKKENRGLKGGKQRLNGDQAVGYMRVRRSGEAGGAVVDGKESRRQDIFSREDRCNNVLFALTEQMQSQKADWKELVQLVVQEKGIRKAGLPLDECVLLAGKVVSGEFEVVLSERKTVDDYILGVDPGVGCYLTIPAK